MKLKVLPQLKGENSCQLSRRMNLMIKRFNLKYLFNLITITVFINLNYSFAQDDYIFFSEAPDTIVVKNEVQYSSIFVDNNENGTAADYWNWRIFAYNNQGIELLVTSDSIYGHNESNWYITVDSIDKRYEIMDLYDQETGQYRHIRIAKGLLVADVVDSDNESHTLAKDIVIMGQERWVTEEPCLCAEDIARISSGPDQISENSEISYTSVFYDEDGSGTYAEYWNWEIVLFHSDGLYTLASQDSVYGYYTYTWTTTINTLPPGYDWIKYENGDVIGYVNVSTIDSDSIFHTYLKIITVNSNLGIENNPTDPGSLPNEFELSQNYPNPFNPTTTINYALKEDSFVELRIHDLLGREVKTLVNGIQPLGFYKVSWDGKDEEGVSMPSGIYIYQIVGGDPSTSSGQGFLESRKMILLR